MQLKLKELFCKRIWSGMKERSHSSTLDTHLQTKPLIVSWYSVGGNLLSCHQVYLISPLCFFKWWLLQYRSDHWCPFGKRPLDPWCFLLESLSLLFWLYHGTQLAVTLITMLNTLVEILSALHLALFLCSVWSQACTILCWIFCSEENSIKGALIIHGARFRFVPHCSETENSPLCYFVEELWIGFLGLMYGSTTLNQAWNIVDHLHDLIVKATEEEQRMNYIQGMCLFLLISLHLRASFRKTIYSGNGYL